MGDDPSEVDCAIFGMLSQIKWHMLGSPHEKFIKGTTDIVIIFLGITFAQYYYLQNIIIKLSIIH